MLSPLRWYFFVVILINALTLANSKKNKKEDIDQQLTELIERTKLQTSTLKKLMEEMEKRKKEKRK